MPLPDLEAQVSAWMRQMLTFRCISVVASEERRELKKGLIGLLANDPRNRPSPDWLGYAHPDPKIAESGLWNLQFIHATPLTPRQLRRLQELA